MRFTYMRIRNGRSRGEEERGAISEQFKIPPLHIHTIIPCLFCLFLRDLRVDADVKGLCFDLSRRSRLFLQYSPTAWKIWKWRTNARHGSCHQTDKPSNNTSTSRQ